MSFTLQPVRVGNGFDEEGMLVFNEDHWLVAVLTHLSEKSGVSPGHWFLEAEFGRHDGLCHPIWHCQLNRIDPVLRNPDPRPATYFQ
jgi:hypothetical protein